MLSQLPLVRHPLVSVDAVNSRISRNGTGDIPAMKIRVIFRPAIAGESNGAKRDKGQSRKFYREQRGETFLYISRAGFYRCRSRNARPLINAGIGQTSNRLEQKAPPRTFFHLSNFSHYREK